MRKVVLLEHMTLDGFLAGPNGEMDWVRFDEDLAEAAGTVIAGADTAIYGRVTFQMMEGYWPTAAEQSGATKHDIEHGSWVNAATKLVFSRTLAGSNWQNTRMVGGDPAGTIAQLKSQPGKNLVLIGSPSLARQFLAQGLIDDFWLSLHPVVLGTGMPLFHEGGQRTELKLTSSRSLPSGVALLRYEKA